MKQSDYIKFKFWLFILGGLLIVALFFIYCSYFKTWGRKFSDLPFWVNIGSDCFGITFFIYPVIFSKFYSKNRNILAKKEKSNKKGDKLR